MNYETYTTIITDLFESVKEEQRQSKEAWKFEDWDDYVHVTVDGSEHVIYYANAWDLVHYVRQHDFKLYTDCAEWLDELGMEFTSLDKHITMMAFQILKHEVMQKVEQRFKPIEEVA